VKNYKGTKHANITIINVYNTTVGKTAYYMCDCGNQGVIALGDILQGKFKTCGRRGCTANPELACPVVLYKDVQMADKKGNAFKSTVVLERKRRYSKRFNNQEEPLVELHASAIINELETFYNKSDYTIIMCSIEETHKYIKNIYVSFGNTKEIVNDTQLVGIRTIKYVGNNNRMRYGTTGYPFKLLKKVIKRINY